MSPNLRQRSQLNAAAKSSALVDGDPLSTNLPPQGTSFHWLSLPQWAKESEYILTGYRQILQ